MTKSSKYTLWLPGQPATVTAQQKGISRSGHVYTKPEVMEERCRLMALIHGMVPLEPLDGALTATLTFCWYRKGQRQPEWRSTRPDWDNIAKLPLDVLEEMGVIKNDSRIAEATVRKLWVPRGMEGIKITLDTAPPLVYNER